MRKNLLFFIMFSICIVVKSQQYYDHIPWELEGANERIETYRKGKAKLVFMLENSSRSSSCLE